MLKTTEKKDFSFVLRSIEDYGGAERMEFLIGVFDNFNDAAKAMEEKVCDHLLANGSEKYRFEDLLENSFGKTYIDIDALETNNHSNNNWFNVSNVMISDTGAEDFLYTLSGGLARQYRRFQKEINDREERIEKEFSKDKPDTFKIASEQRFLSNAKEHKKFIDECVEPSFLKDIVENHKKIEAQQTNVFLSDIDTKLQSRDKEKYTEIMNQINANVNGGTMEDAFKNAKRLGNR